MVREIRVTTDDETFGELVEAKGDRTWEEALVEEMVGGEGEED